MSMSDNIADMLTRIRNGQKSKLLKINLPMSNLKCTILDVLKSDFRNCVKNQNWVF